MNSMGQEEFYWETLNNDLYISPLKVPLHALFTIACHKLFSFWLTIHIRIAI